MNPQFAVSVHDIDAGGLQRSFDLGLPWLEHALADTDVTAAEPGHADVRLSKTGHDVVVRGKVTATLSMPCARCLRPAAIPVEGELSLLLRPARPETANLRHAPAREGHAASKAAAGKAAAGAPHAHAKKAGGKDPSKANGTARRPRDDDEYEFTSEEADVDVFDGETIVLDDFLREALLLEAPSFPLCSEDCPGIRPSARAGHERGEPVIDPRLSPLRALKTKLMLAASSPDATPEGQGAADEGAPAAPGEAAAQRPAPERPVLPGKAARPRLQAHRTAGAIGASGAVKKKARAKHSPKKKAK